MIGASATKLTAWGNPSRFEIALGWAVDEEPRDRRPAHGGWSTGEMRLTVGGLVLTRHVQAGVQHDASRWFLLPVVEWLAASWISLLHEERFAWRENEALPAASAVVVALDRWIGSTDAAGRAAYRSVQAWWSRHAMRACDPSALYPDIVMRRLGDDVEISWTARPPVHAPDGFRLELTPGAAILRVADVAGPLWEALAWSVMPPAPLDDHDRRSVESLEVGIERLAELPTAALESGYLDLAVLSLMKRAEKEFGRCDNSERVDGVPALSRLDDAVLMFGGVSPDIGPRDVATLTEMMSKQHGRCTPDTLSAFVRSDIGPPLTAPYEEGYDLAEGLLDSLNLPDETTNSIDIDDIVGKLGIRMIRAKLETSTIRGVALAGETYAPAILINLASHYNKIRSGQRFTAAHELFHILYDQRRARRVAHTSGPWASAGVEKRANAFAAMLLMPRQLLQRVHRRNRWSAQSVADAAIAMDVGASALTEHLYNTTLIDEGERDRLRAEFRSSLPARPRPASGRGRTASPSRF